MDLKDLYALLKGKLKQMYKNGMNTVTLEQVEFFAAFKAVCDLIQIKNITDSQ